MVAILGLFVVADDRAAPWSGECVVVLAGRRVVVACRVASGAAGPTIVLAVGSPGRRGARLGLRFDTVARSDEGAALRWSAEADERNVRWEDRGIVLHGTFRRLGFPMVVPLSPLPGTQGAGVIPSKVSGRCRIGTVQFDIPTDDSLAALAGRHRAVLVGGPSVAASAARAVRASPLFRARGRAAEPLS